MKSIRIRNSGGRWHDKNVGRCCPEFAGTKEPMCAAGHPKIIPNYIDGTYPKLTLNKTRGLEIQFLMIFSALCKYFDKIYVVATLC